MEEHIPEEDEEEIGLAGNDLVVEAVDFFDVNNIVPVVVCLLVVIVFEICTAVLLGKTIWDLQSIGTVFCTGNCPVPFFLDVDYQVFVASVCVCVCVSSSSSGMPSVVAISI